MSAKASLKIWIDGAFHDKENAKVSVYDHGLLYGDGVFEGIRAYGGKIFQCDAHLRRLFDSARAIRLNQPYTMEQLKTALEETVRINHFTDCYIRLVISRGPGYLGLSPTKCPTPTVFIIADTIELYPPELYESGMSIITSSVIRNHPNAMSPRIKSLNYLNNILAKIEAINAGVPEALMLNHEGNVAECTSENIFIARGGVVQTPGTADGILEGVTRAVMIELCHRMKIPCVEKSLQRHDVYTADECFLTGTGCEVIPVTKIDGVAIGTGQPGGITRKLIDGFRRFIREG